MKNWTRAYHPPTYLDPPTSLYTQFTWQETLANYSRLLWQSPIFILDCLLIFLSALLLNP